jgi:RimJ/RimL family protein N-acetyltransferase
MNAMPWPPDVTLEGEHATLAPLQPDHTAALAEAVADGELWKLWYTSVPAPEEMAAAIAERIELRAQGAWSPFVVIERSSGEPVGMTNYMRIDPKAPRVEIGGTWYRRRVQRSPLNTECKLMLLTHAFETLNCVSVEFRTHVLNQQSRRAIERLGARLDGILRNETRTRDGNLRDTCCYSIIDSEWPTVRTHLRHQLEKKR